MTINFKDFPLSEVGHTVGMIGTVWEGDGHEYVMYLPKFARGGPNAPITVRATDDDWAALLRQSDFVETEVLSKTPDGELHKAIVRKCTRSIEQQVQWNVYKRDGYKCRYCGADNVPLTVDHLITWEEGGPSIESNLAAVCRKDNKERGRMPYAKWLRSAYYRNVSQNLTQEVRELNAVVATTLADIPRAIGVRSR